MDNWLKKLLQKIRSAIGRPDDRANFTSIETMIGIPDAANSCLDDMLRTGYDSSAITANHDGSMAERLEATRDDLVEAISNVNDLGVSDKDTFDWADADGNTERWDVEYISGTEGGSADINTTVAGKAMAKVDPDVTPTAAGYSLSKAIPITTKYLSVIVDFDATFGADTASWKDVNLQVSTGAAYDANNRVCIQKQHQTAANQRFIASAWFNAVAETQYIFSSTDISAAFKIERLDNVWRVYYSLVQSPDYSWTLLAQYEDPSEFMDAQVSVYIGAYSPGEADAATAQGNFDNLIIRESLEGVTQQISGDYDSSATVADEDGSISERLEQIQEAVNRGTGSSVPANKSLYDVIGATYLDAGGGLGTDSVVSDLSDVHTHADDVDTDLGEPNDAAIDPSGLAGSLHAKVHGIGDRWVGADVGTTYDVLVAHGVAEQDIVAVAKSTRYGISFYLDVQALVTANEGGTLTIRAYNKIDETNYKVIAKATFVVGVDTVFPSFEIIRVNHNTKFTLQCSVAVTVTRTINYRYITQDFE